MSKIRESFISHRTKFSVCIPAYNRAHYLPMLLDSIYTQDCKDFEVVICEDASCERKRIAVVAHEYSQRHPGTLRYFENESNLGYDGNIRRLVEKAAGEFCFFMGNDDLMCDGALSTVADILERHDNIGLVLKSYAWFNDKPKKIEQEIRYFSDEREFAAGREAIRVCYRRSGVISGYIVHRDSAYSVETSRFDGTLHYQMHLSANVLASRRAVFTPVVLVHCRNSRPEFGASPSERGKYTPGHYTPEARLRMISGSLSIIQYLSDSQGIDVVDDVICDYANYFYPCVKDQLDLPVGEFIALYRSFAEMGFGHHPMFHLYCLLGYVLGERTVDSMVRTVRNKLGRSPLLGQLKRLHQSRPRNQYPMQETDLATTTALQRQK